MQVQLPEGRTVVPIILSSDSTQLTSFTGKHSCYPVYLTIGNIAKHARRAPSMRAQRLVGYLPVGKLDKSFSARRSREARTRLYHDSMRLICQSLFVPARDGIRLADSQGAVRLCHTVLASYIADYPEQCLVTCTRYGQACPICFSKKKSFGRNEHGELRDQSLTWATIDAFFSADSRDSRKTTLDELNIEGLNPVDQPFWLDWSFANVHAAMTSDVLHQLVQGMGKHLVQWLIALADPKELDARVQRLPLAHNLRRFKQGITGLANISGGEHKAIYAQIIGCVHGLAPDAAVQAASALLDFLYVAQYECHSTHTLHDLRTALSEFHELKHVFEQQGVRSGVFRAKALVESFLTFLTDFDLPKLHALQHYVHSIERLGTTDNYNTEATERQHIDQAKRAFAASNKRDFIAQMCRWLERREAVFWFATYLEWRVGGTFVSGLQKPCTKPRATLHHEAVQVSLRPDHRHVTLQQLDIDYGVPGFKTVLSSFLRKWHHIRTYRGYEPKLPYDVTKALKILGSVGTWNLAKFRTPNLQTLAAPDLISKVYASPMTGRFDTVLVQTKHQEDAGATGLDGA